MTSPAALRPTIPYMGVPEDEVRRAFDQHFGGMALQFRHSPAMGIWVLENGMEFFDRVAASHGGDLQHDLNSILVPVVEYGRSNGRDDLDSLDFTKATAPADLRRPRPRIEKPRWRERVPTKHLPVPRRTYRGKPSIPGMRQTRGGYDLAPRSHITAAEQLPVDLVVRINRSQRGEIAALVTDAITHGWDPEVLGAHISNVVGLFPRWQRAVTKLHQGLLDSGTRPDIAMRRANLYGDRLRAKRGLMIARTELMRAMNIGRLEGWREKAEDGLFDPEATIKTWRAAPDACPECDALNGVRVVGIETPFLTEFGEMLMPPSHPHCFPAGTIVSGPPVVGVVERWYEGDVIDIRTKMGHVVTATPNHPMLTPKGWIAAGLLNEGDNLIDGSLLQGVTRRVPNDEQIPTLIEEVASSFGGARGVTPMTMPVSAEQFHGDGLGSDVCVVWAYGLLGDEPPNACAAQVVAQEELPGGHEPNTLTRFGDLDQVLVGVGGPSSRLVSGLGQSGPFDGVGLGHSRIHGVGTATRLDPFLKEDPADYVPRGPDGLSQSLLACAGEVSVDKIIDVKIRSFQGHVYNLQTEGQWYIANGIVVHNCRCTATIKPKR